MIDRLEIPKADGVIIVAGLMENDDSAPVGVSKAVFTKCGRHALKSGRAAAVKSLRDCDRRILINQVQLQDNENDDDLVGVKELRLTEDLLRTCRTRKGWHKKNLRIAGDGGRYRLQFAVKAEPM